MRARFANRKERAAHGGHSARGRACSARVFERCDFRFECFDGGVSPAPVDVCVVLVSKCAGGVLGVVERKCARENDGRCERAIRAAIAFAGVNANRRERGFAREKTRFVVGFVHGSAIVPALSRIAARLRRHGVVPSEARMLRIECESCHAPYQVDERRVPAARAGRCRCFRNAGTRFRWSATGATRIGARSAARTVACENENDDGRSRRRDRCRAACDEERDASQGAAASTEAAAAGARACRSVAGRRSSRGASAPAASGCCSTAPGAAASDCETARASSTRRARPARTETSDANDADARGVRSACAARKTIFASRGARQSRRSRFARRAQRAEACGEARASTCFRAAACSGVWRNRSARGRSRSSASAWRRKKSSARSGTRGDEVRIGFAGSEEARSGRRSRARPRTARCGSSCAASRSAVGCGVASGAKSGARIRRDRLAFPRSELAATGVDAPAS